MLPIADQPKYYSLIDGPGSVLNMESVDSRDGNDNPINNKNSRKLKKAQ